MSAFEEVDEIPNATGAGRPPVVSEELIREFLKSKKKHVKLNTNLEKMISTYVTLKAYVAAHNLPVKIVKRSKEIYLERTDNV